MQTIETNSNQMSIHHLGSNRRYLPNALLSTNKLCLPQLEMLQSICQGLSELN